MYDVSKVSKPKPKAGDARVVWSSDDGDLRRAADPKPSGPSGPADPVGSPSPRPAGGRVEVRRETAGRRGKAVTTVRGLPLDDDELRAIAGRLKRRCGVGGSAKDGVIELQGDHRGVVVNELAAAGYQPVLAGG
ncbi:MAG: translation initiation factor 1 [Solirubrobacteraceae bacterium]|nr:translation initiation factor 1 [Solirubrobacteraceae bacterium]